MQQDSQDTVLHGPALSKSWTCRDPGGTWGPEGPVGTFPNKLRDPESGTCRDLGPKTGPGSGQVPGPCNTAMTWRDALMPVACRQKGTFLTQDVDVQLR
jgi:hypothetical protein